MSVKLGPIVIFLALVILTIYNMRLNMRLVKARTGRLRDLRSLSPTELDAVKSLNKEKRKWVLLGQILFWTSMLFVFFGSFTILVFFLDLYTVTSVISNQIDLNATEILNAK